MKTKTYYAGAINDDGRIGVLLVTREMIDGGGSRPVSQEWTGETFPDTAAGYKAIDALFIERNCGGCRV